MAGCWSTPPRTRVRRRHPAVQFRRQRGGDLRQRHALRRGAAGGARAAAGDRSHPHRRRSQAPAPARRARACDFKFEMNMGRAGDHASRTLRPAARRADRAMSRWSGWAIRNAPCRWTISTSTGARWAPRSNRIRIFPIAPMSRSCRPVDEHTIDVRFYERGAGETMSSGTGSTGAAAAAIARGMVAQPGARADARRAARSARRKRTSS